jgi:hypothetical protein
METTLATMDFRHEANALQQELNEFSLGSRQSAGSEDSTQPNTRLMARLRRLIPLVGDPDCVHALPPAQRRGYVQLFCLVQTMRMDLRHCDTAII